MTGTQQHYPADLTDQEIAAELPTADEDRAKALRAEQEERRIRRRENPPHVYGFPGRAKRLRRLCLQRVLGDSLRRSPGRFARQEGRKGAGPFAGSNLHMNCHSLELVPRIRIMPDLHHKPFITFSEK